MTVMITGLGIDPGAHRTGPRAHGDRPAARRAGPSPPRHLGALDEDNLFEGGLVASIPRKRSRWQRIAGRVSLVAHVVIVAGIVLVPIFWPEELPEQGERRVFFLNPPPPPPPPLPKGNPMRPQEAKPEPAKPVTETVKPKPEFTAPIETPQPQTAQLQPEAGVHPDDQFGSATGSDLGDPLGMEEGVEGGVVGGVPGGVLGGVLGGTGTGPVMDYDSPPRPIKITRPQYPQEAFVKKIEGTVVVEILIDSQGRVVRARVIQSVPLLDAAALQTVYQWIFQPAVKHGRPVPTIAHAPVAFRIY
jgi:protein TonB